MQTAYKICWKNRRDEIHCGPVLKTRDDTGKIVPQTKKYAEYLVTVGKKLTHTWGGFTKHWIEEADFSD